MFTLSLVTWFVICLVTLPIAYAVVTGLYRSKMRKRKLIADFRKMRAERRARFNRGRAVA